MGGKQKGKLSEATEGKQSRPAPEAIIPLTLT